MVECTRSRDGRHHWNRFRRADVGVYQFEAVLAGYCEFRVSCHDCGVVTTARVEVKGRRIAHVRAVTTDQFFKRGR